MVTGIFHDDASLKETIVEALEDIQSENFELACAIAIELARDFEWFGRA